MSRLLLSPAMIRFAFFVERWVLSFLSLFLAYEFISTLQLMHLVSQSRDLMPASAVARDAGFLDGVHFEDYARYGLLAGSNLACGLLLLFSYKPSRYPTKPQEILVPMAATFSYSVFNQNLPLPWWMTCPLAPAGWLTTLAGLGVALSMIGIVLALASILKLGRSLGIMVSVREIVLAGPYRYVRHPIYLGYMILFVGLFLTACNVRMTLMVCAAGALLWWRARLEEAVLSAHSLAYKEWMSRTGFLWPKGWTWTSRNTDGFPLLPLVDAVELVSLPE